MQQIIEFKELPNKINYASDIFKMINKIRINYQQENFLLLCLNTKNNIIHTELIFKGGLNNCIIDVRTIFRVALKYNSCNIIIAHNHPSGILEPSQEDKDAYKLVKNAGDIIGITCLDSIIFNYKEFYSMNEKYLSDKNKNL